MKLTDTKQLTQLVNQAQWRHNRRKKYYLTDKVRKQNRNRMRLRRNSKRVNLSIVDYKEAIE